MANHFKDYKSKLNNKKTSVLSEDEIKTYSKTSNNEGVSHDHDEWKEYSANSFINEEKKRTILRDIEREQKIKNSADNLSEK